MSITSPVPPVLIFQDDSHLPSPYHKWACHLFCHYAIAQLALGKALTLNQIDKLTMALRLAGFVTDELALPTEDGPYAVGKATFAMLGKPRMRLSQIGSIREGNVSFWAAMHIRRFDYVILRGKLADGADHSVLLDADLIEVYNPSPDSVIVSDRMYLLYAVYTL